MRTMILSAVLLAVGGMAFAEAPFVSGVTLTQDEAKGEVTIAYSLANAPAIVTLDIETNGVSIGAANIRTLSGPMNCRVDKAGTYSVTWLADRDWEGSLDASARAVVKAWRLARPPDYMVVDLVVASNVCYYASANDLPGGLLDNRDYRTTKLVMRRIPAKDVTWLMGTIGERSGGELMTDEAPHAVTLGADYWIGVFEFTQAQWACVKGDGSRPSKLSLEYDWPMRPVEQVSYNEIRHGASASGTYTDNYYPAAPGEGSLLSALRALTGLAFDLPGEAQWEFACRAGTGEGALNDGSRYCDIYGYDRTTRPDDPMRSSYVFPGRNQMNGGGVIASANETTFASNATAVVGSYAPSKWGTYDMHGNVAEFCLDWYAADITGLNGAVNTVVGEYRVARGGRWNYHACEMRSGCRLGIYSGGRRAENLGASDSASRTYGFRVCSPVVTE